MKAIDFIEKFRKESFVLSEDLKSQLKNDKFRSELYKVILLKDVFSFHSLLQILFDFELSYRLDETHDGEFFENIYHCAFLLFKIGDLQDVIPMWKAKRSDFDLGCGFDVQFLVGAGVQKTIDFLENIKNPDAEKAIEYIQSCQKAGDFDDLPKWESFRKDYFAIN